MLNRDVVLFSKNFFRYLAIDSLYITQRELGKIINQFQDNLPLLYSMRWFIVVSATVHEILGIKIPKTMLTQQKFNKILQLQILISLKQ